MLIRIFSKIILMIAMLISSAALGQTVDDCTEVPGAVTIDDFKMENGNSSRPESVQWDPKSGFWYGSNQGSPTDPTDGFISKLNPDGTVAELKWVTGLGHPSGIRIFKDKLYVADRDHNAVANNVIAVIDIAEGTIVKTYSISPSLLNGGGVNDPVVDKKTDAIYVSVFNNVNANLGNTVLMIPLAGDGSDAVQLAPPGGPFTPQPNGTLLYKHDLIVMKTNGEFMIVDLDTGDIEVLGSTSFMPPGGVLDGIERDGGEFLFTKNGGNNTNRESLFARIRFQPDGTVKEQRLCTLPPDPATGPDVGGAADIGINRDSGVVAIPHLFGGKITFVSLDEFTENEE